MPWPPASSTRVRWIPSLRHRDRVSAEERAGRVAEQEPRAWGLQGPRTPGCLPGVGGQKLEQWPSLWPGPNRDTATVAAAPCPSSTAPRNPEPPGWDSGSPVQIPSGLQERPPTSGDTVAKANL